LLFILNTKLSDSGKQYSDNTPNQPVLDLNRKCTGLSNLFSNGTPVRRWILPPSVENPPPITGGSKAGVNYEPVVATLSQQKHFHIIK
jgi:hypothetical protein